MISVANVNTDGVLGGIGTHDLLYGRSRLYGVLAGT